MFIKQASRCGLVFFISSAISLQASENEKALERIQVLGNSSLTGLGLLQQNSAASRLNLTSLETPASVEILSKEDIANKADFSSLSAVTRSTGFASSATPGNGGMSMSVRGFNGHGSVVQSYDGSRLYVGAGTVTFPADTWTLEKVEVLRGPGSVTNGIGAIGGTVNYVPKKAEFTPPKNELDVAIGSFNLHRIAVGSGGELTSKTAYRIDAVNHQSDGYVDRGDEKRDVIAASLLYVPRSDLEVKFSVDYADIEAAPYWGTPLVNGKIVDSTRTHNYNVKDGLVEYTDVWPRMNVKWAINNDTTLNSDLFYIDAKRHWKNVESYTHDSSTNNVDRSFYLEILHEQSQLGNRNNLTLDSRFSGFENRLSVGFDVNAIEFEHVNNRPYDGQTSVDLNNPQSGYWADGVISETTDDFSSDTLQYAVFIDDQIKFDNGLSIVTGLRHDVVDFKRKDVARSNGEKYAQTKDNYKSSNWRLGLVYQPTKNASIYIQSSQSVDPIQSIITSSNPDLKLAQGKQFEVGFKQALLNNKLQYSIALYDIEKNNLLSNGPGDIEYQVGKQSSQGVEFDIFAAPMDGWDIDFNVSYVDAKFDTFSKEGENLAGNNPKNIPAITSNLWSNVQLADYLKIGGGARYVASRYADDENTSKMPKYIVYDATVQWQLKHNIKLSLHGKNLSDEKNYVLAPYGQQWVLAEGRCYQLGLNYQF